MKRVLVLQDLGISSNKLDELIAKYKIPYEFVDYRNKEISDKSNVVGIITVKQTVVDAKLLKQFPNVTFVAVSFTGYDCVDLEETKKRNITVFNVPTYATDSTAELAIGLTISLIREIPKSNQLIRSGEWDLKAGYELTGKTVGIIGTGRIGIRAAQLFKTFHCKIIGWSKTQKDEFLKLGSYKQDINHVFKEADIISIHLPLNSSTKGMINRQLLSLMKPTSYLVNVARGPIVATSDLAQVLSENKIAGAAVDVFDVEPIAKDNPLLNTPNTILTPHIAYKTNEALIRRADVTIKNIRCFIDGKPQNVVSS